MLTDNYNTAYDRAYNNYLLGYNTALGQYETGRSEAFSDYQTKQNQWFTSTENEKDRQYQTEENDKAREENNKNKTKGELIDLIENYGYQPTDDELAAAGITKAQAEAYAKAYTQKQEASTSKDNTNANNTTKYADFDYEAQAKWGKEFERAGSLADVDRIADRMEQAGIDPQIVANWRDYYAQQFEVEAENTPTGVVGGGGGTWYMEVR